MNKETDTHTADSRRTAGNNRPLKIQYITHMFSQKKITLPVSYYLYGSIYMEIMEGAVRYINVYVLSYIVQRIFI